MIKRMLSTFTTESILPEEKSCCPKEKSNSLLIGIPKERGDFEKRLPLTPEAIAILCNQGHHVILETGAGDSIHYSDHVFSEAGAEIADHASSVWECDIILKIAVPLVSEIALMKPRATLISLLQLSLFSPEVLTIMSEKRINAVAYDFITDAQGSYPIINQIREIEGKAAVVLAAELLTNERGGKGILLGGCAGVSPTEVLILGAGRAGSEAARTAGALGALVKVFDNHVDALRLLQRTLGASTFTSTLHPRVLQNALRTADVAIGALRLEKGEKQFFVSADMVRQMKPGALIIDLSVDQGGCFETSICPASQYEAFFEQYGVLHYCLPNISSRVARTTSISLSNHILPLIQEIADANTISDCIRENAYFRSGVYFYNGKLVNPTVGEHFDYPWSDIMLFLTSFQ
ncbi:MAG: alanine dehydrogenase [Bacteroidales bacterium]